MPCIRNSCNSALWLSALFQADGPLNESTRAPSTVTHHSSGSALCTRSTLGEASRISTTYASAITAPETAGPGKRASVSIPQEKQRCWRELCRIGVSARYISVTQVTSQPGRQPDGDGEWEATRVPSNAPRRPRSGIPLAPVSGNRARLPFRRPTRAPKLPTTTTGGRYCLPTRLYAERFAREKRRSASEYAHMELRVRGVFCDGWSVPEDTPAGGNWTLNNRLTVAVHHRVRSMS
jgi:hypothetical protein